MSQTESLPNVIMHYQALSRADEHFEVFHRYQIIHHSTALAGNSLSLEQTVNLLRTDLPPEYTPTIHQWMVLDYQQAQEYVLTLASQREPLNLVHLQQLAALVMQHTGGRLNTLLDSFDTSQGEWRTLSTTADNKLLLDARKIPTAMLSFVKDINSSIGKCKTIRQQYELSFTAHCRLLSLYPFGAGNGRVAQLLMNYVQRYTQLPLSYVHVEARRSYQQAVHQSRQNPIHLIDFMFSQLTQGLTKQ